VVPGSIFSESSKGTHPFLRLGAQAATSAADILQTLGLEQRTSAALELRTDLSKHEIRILNLIAAPLSRDELIRVLELPITEANVLLSAMELKGLIVEDLGIVRSA